MRLLDALARTPPGQTEARGALNFDQYLELVMSASGRFPFGQWMAGSQPDLPDQTFLNLVHQVHRRNGVIAAAVVARALLLSEIRFAWRNNRMSSSPGQLWGNRDLEPLERPGTMTRHELLIRLELEASYAGNAYVLREGRRLRRLRPDYMTVVLGSDSDPEWKGDLLSVPYDAELIGYVYHPPNGRLQAFSPREVAHWKPEPDPEHFWRGSSWVTSVLREFSIDSQVTDHQSKFFENAATPNIVFIMRPDLKADEVEAYAKVVNAKHAGAMNAYKNMFLGGGTDAKVVGSTLESLALKDVSGGFETRVALRSRVPAVVLGIREGLAGSALNSGNYAQTRRLLADGWFTPTAKGLCAALERIVPPPADSDLAFDPAEVLFLQEDQKDAADIASTNAQAIRALVEAGYDPNAAVEAVKNGDLSKLMNAHSGLYSVQLQPAVDPASQAANGAEAPAEDDEPSETDQARALAEILQKLYLSVGVVITQDEARQIVNRAGAQLPIPAPADPVPDTPQE